MHRWPGVGGVMLAGDSWGPSDGPLVLLQHGGGQTRHAWKSAGEALGRAGYHAIAFDARGHGDSDWAPDGVYGQDIMVEDLCSLLKALKVPRPVLVGASMGGGTSLVAVGEDRVDATALVLVDIAPQIEPEGVQKIGAFMNYKPEGFDTLEEVAAAIAAYQPHRKPPKDLAGLGQESAPPTASTVWRTCVRGTPATAHVSAVSAALCLPAARPEPVESLVTKRSDRSSGPEARGQDRDAAWR
jgi:pimeloyl-ACP methyl ester carboxylesterase